MKRGTRTRNASASNPATDATVSLVEEQQAVVFAERVKRARAIGKPGGESDGSPPWTEKYQRRAGSELSPQYITTCNRNADLGRMSAYADLLDELHAADPHLSAVLFKRSSRVASARWEVTPTNTTRKKALAKETARFCTELVQGIPHLSQVLLHLLGAIYHGRSAVELMWGETAGLGFVPQTVLPIHPRRLSYAAMNWELHLYDETGQPSKHTMYPGTPLSAYPAGKFVVHRPTSRGEYPTREGIGRIVQWFALFKRWTMRDWMAFAELAGRPGRIGYFGTGGANPEVRANALPAATPDHVKDLHYAMQEWTGAAFAVLPDTVRAEFVNIAAGYQDLHEKLIALINAEISKAVLGGTLTTDPGKLGARALGDTQQDEQLLIARWDARVLGEALTYQLLAPAVRYNYGPDAPVPQLILDVSPDKDRVQFAQYVKTLAEAGLNIPQSWVRDELNIPEAKQGESVLVPREPVEVDAAGIPTNTDPSTVKDTHDKVKRVETKPVEPFGKTEKKDKESEQ